MADTPDQHRWARLQEHFAAALDLPAEQRADYLSALPDDLRDEVSALVESHAAEGRLDRISSALAELTRGEADVPGEEVVPETVGPYRIEGLLGEGGMGFVLRARRGDATFALKLLHADGDSERIRRRFDVEREILRGLDHPAIARMVDDGATEDGRPYVVLELVEGVPIDRHCDDARLSVSERVGLFAEVCDAVEHAHGLGVVHRDIKPANVLVTAEGRPKLLDFGIAKVLEGTAMGGLHRQTTAGVHVLTLEWGSPEQILGRPITPASDVYQLGLLLHRLLVGAMPPVTTRVARRGGDADTAPRVPPPSSFLAQDAGSSGLDVDAEAVAAARSTDPHALSRRLRGGLDGVVLRCLSLSPLERYPSARALADDARRVAKRGGGGALSRFGRWAVGVAVAVTLAVLATLVGG